MARRDKRKKTLRKNTRRNSRRISRKNTLKNTKRNSRKNTRRNSLRKNTLRKNTLRKNLKKQRIQKKHKKRGGMQRARGVRGQQPPGLYDRDPLPEAWTMERDQGVTFWTHDYFETLKAVANPTPYQIELVDEIPYKVRRDDTGNYDDLLGRVDTELHNIEADIERVEAEELRAGEEAEEAAEQQALLQEQDMATVERREERKQHNKARRQQRQALNKAIEDTAKITRKTNKQGQQLRYDDAKVMFDTFAKQELTYVRGRIMNNPENSVLEEAIRQANEVRETLDNDTVDEWSPYGTGVKQMLLSNHLASVVTQRGERYEITDDVVHICEKENDHWWRGTTRLRKKVDTLIDEIDHFVTTCKGKITTTPVEQLHNVARLSTAVSAFNP
jgi:hypothetical protein